ncbi:WXG100 family type VII secretion target [Cryptosporangium arvum]|uniref:Excreted virulence factor EspC, type VII ESX diderm n=1 Tax=Cryptosporangium arvum DSM 44712 TaxID=927661 RepID=A0A010YP89_9ACTN|nr:hypothetical protein [Cryptosporangium arvum]EXG82005.1 hypothetical protein CryarDRAFT_3136 [Cryptosporangium arvum DSM 44712]
MSTRVDPAALLTASGAVDELGGTVRTHQTALESDTLGTGGAVPGFRTRHVLERLAYGWSDALNRHRDYLDELGTALADAATGYRRSDDDTAAEFRALDRY